ncbi:hypothetical protein ACVGXS_03755, partial [Enterobacter hormaechei]
WVSFFFECVGFVGCGVWRFFVVDVWCVVCGVVCFWVGCVPVVVWGCFWWLDVVWWVCVFCVFRLVVRLMVLI